MTYEIIALTTIVAFVLAGVSWNTLGIWQKWRGGVSSKVDWDRVKKNVIIGIVLGVIAYGIKVSQTGDGSDVPIVLASIDDFVLTITAAFPLVILADKIFNRKKK